MDSDLKRHMIDKQPNTIWTQTLNATWSATQPNNIWNQTLNAKESTQAERWRNRWDLWLEWMDMRSGSGRRTRIKQMPDADSSWRRQDTYKEKRNPLCISILVNFHGWPPSLPLLSLSLYYISNSSQQILLLLSKGTLFFFSVPVYASQVHISKL